MNECVESEVVRSIGAQARHLSEDRVSIKSTDSERVIFEKGARANAAYEE